MDDEIAYAEDGDPVMISQGAEARVYGVTLFGAAAVAKHRFAKTYRSPSLDKRLRKDRTLAEVRCLGRCRQLGISTPALFMVDRYVIYMERVRGVTAKTYIDDHPEQRHDVMTKIGNVVGRLHDNGITHGDLTTSNFLCRPNLDVVVIDFGLSGTRASNEDKAVDLYVLERALLSTHGPGLLDSALSEYQRISTNPSPVFHRLDAVRARGRKRECFG